MIVGVGFGIGFINNFFVAYTEMETGFAFLMVEGTSEKESNLHIQQAIIFTEYDIVETFVR